MRNRIDTFLEQSGCLDLSSSELDVALLDVARNQTSYPLVVPWRSARDMSRWYVLADASCAERVREEALAHMGVSFTDFDGCTTPLKDNDQADVAVRAAWPDALVTRIELVDIARRSTVAVAAERLGRRFATMVSLQGPEVHTAATLLRQFQMSLLAFDEVESGLILAELRRRALLSPVNCLFLEFQLDATFRDPLEIFDSDLFADVGRLSRPAAVTDLMASTIDRAVLRPGGAGGVADVLQRYNDLPQSFRGVLTSLGECRSASGVLLVGLHAVATGKKLDRRPLSIELDDLVQTVLDMAFESGEMAEAVASNWPLQDLFLEGDFDRLLALAVELGSSRSAVEAALIAATRLHSIWASRVALDLLANAPAKVQHEVRAVPLFARLVDELVAFAGGGDLGPRSEVTSWCSVFEQLTLDADWPGVGEFARHGSVEWAVTSPDAGTDGGAALSELIRRACYRRHPQLDVVMPSLLVWLQRACDSGNAEAVRHSLCATFEYLARPNSPNSDVRVLCGTLEVILSLSLSTGEIHRLLSELGRRLSEGVHRSIAPRLLDAVFACMDQSHERGRLDSGLIRSILDPARLVVPPTAHGLTFIAGRLAGQLGGTGVADGGQVSSSGRASSVLLAARATAGVFAAECLASLWPSIEVHLENGIEVDESAIEWIVNCDLVVLTADASAAMRTAVASMRGRDRELRVLATTGPAGIVEEIERWVENIG